MWSFYWALIRGIPKALWNAVDLTISASAFVMFFLTLFNRRIGERLMTSWNAISPWWSLVPVGIIVTYALMRSNYENYCRLESSLNQVISGLTSENAALKKDVYELRNPKTSPDEMRRRPFVLDKLKHLTQSEKEMLRYIWQFGPISPYALLNENRFVPSDVQRSIASGSLLTTQVVSVAGRDWSIKDEFKSALDFALTSEGL